MVRYRTLRRPAYEACPQGGVVKTTESPGLAESSWKMPVRSSVNWCLKCLKTKTACTKKEWIDERKQAG
jgi:hypothetical protein